METIHKIEHEYRATALRPPTAPWRGLDALAHAWIGRRRRRPTRTREAWLVEAARADEIRSEAGEWTADRVERRLGELRRDWRRSPAGRPVVRAEALGLIAEAARRALGLTAHPVQLAAAIGLDEGALVELATGEGKSLAAALAAVLAAWTGRPCHVLTVNDYLATRDAAGFKGFYARCGVSVGAVLATDAPTERRVGHANDITYTTGKELLADFLRDRIALGTVTEPERRLLRRLRGGPDLKAAGGVLRGLGVAIVDEADSVLIDEAVTPLIISRRRDDAELAAACASASQVAPTLEAGCDYVANARRRELRLKPKGRERVAEQAAAFPPVWRGAARREELVERALEAREFFQRGRHYEVQDGKVVIVDEFTGRLMPGRSWREGLHQAIEAREELAITPPTETMIRLSFQRFFRLFPRLCGTTGTAREAAGELWAVYNLPVVALPTHRPRRLVEHAAEAFLTEAEKWDAVVARVRELRAAGRPVLVGLRSVAASEALSARLDAEGVPHQVLNALRHREEAEIVLRAGEAGRVTLATNMAGRGTDIRLGEGVAQAGGLAVIGTERHESARIDRQLIGRAGRQGDSGDAYYLLSLEDELVRRHLPGWAKNWGWRLGGAQRWLRFAQWRAEAQSALARRRVLAQDEALEESLALAGRGVG